MRIQHQHPLLPKQLPSLPVKNQQQQPDPPQDKLERPWGKALLKGVVYGAVGTLLGAGMAQGGAGGLVSGAIAGATLGLIQAGRTLAEG